MKNNYLTVESLNDILQFDRQTMRLASFLSKSVPDQEFISSSDEHPTFVIGYLDSRKRYRFLNSYEAENIGVKYDYSGSLQTLTAVYSKIAGYDIQVTCTVKASKHERFTRWNISVVNNCGLEVLDLQYPFIVCSYDLHGTPNSEAIQLPHGYGSGKLIEKPGEVLTDGSAWKQKLAPDSWREWEFCSRTGDFNHYPGMQFAQFLAYYNDRAGLYMACDDTEANIKRFAVLHRKPGIRLGISHVGDWPTQGERTLEYDTVLSSFNGDWYDAADIYREWSFKQKWFTPLYKRQDIPQWLVDSPVYITIRPQGILDIGQVYPVNEFLPYEKCIPLLEKVSESVQAPLCVMLMGWERGGSWVYPDSFPPVGGEESMKSFISSIKEHGWQAGSFCNGTRWVFGQCWNDYDGREYFVQNHGEESVCCQADGSMWYESWDSSWRPSFACCLGSEKTRQIAVNFVKHLVDWGMESLQFLDQNNGSSTFPCFSSNHEHPPVPGKWMAEKMRQLVEEFHKAAQECGKNHVIHSAEAGLNEFCIPLFQQTELRIFPPNYGVEIVPLFQYLFHECVILQGMMGNAPEPYHLVIRNAANCVLGGIPGGVLTGDGTLLDKDTNNWAPWEPKVENSENAFAMIRNVTALRRGQGKNFLVYGRMLRPAEVNGIKAIEWTSGNRNNRIPVVFHSAWQTPDGRFGIVLANWTKKEQVVAIKDERLGSEVCFHTYCEKNETNLLTECNNGFMMRVPPLGCTIIYRK